MKSNGCATEHGVAILWDAHSIVGVAPRLFEGRLPDFNLGTADGASCDPTLAESLFEALQRHPDFTSVLNGRFKGGHITRTFGAPSKGVHAVQMEMVEATYMDETCPYTFRGERADLVRPILREQLEIALAFAQTSRCTAVPRSDSARQVEGGSAMSNFFARQGAAYANDMKRCVRRPLVGIAQGVLCDGVLSDKEIDFLDKWLNEHDAIAHEWPGDVLPRQGSSGARGRDHVPRPSERTSWFNRSQT